MSDFEPEYVEYHIDWRGNTHINTEQRNDSVLSILSGFGIWLICLFILSVAY
jgi:hypothetical protein